MYSETKSTLKGPDMILEEIGIFIKVDGFKSQFSQALPTISIGGRLRCYTTASELRTCAVLSKILVK